MAGRSVETKDFLTNPVTDPNHQVAEGTGNMDEDTENAMAQETVGIGVFLLKIDPELLALGNVLLGSALGEEGRGGNRDDLQIIAHVFALMHILDLFEIDGGHHELVDFQGLINALDHDGLLNRLILTADEVVIEVFIDVVHGFDASEGNIDIQLVHIEGMSGQFQSAGAQEFRSVNAGFPPRRRAGFRGAHDCSS